LQGIEPAKNELAERVITTRQHAIRPAGADEMEGLADGVGPGCAGIGNDPQWAAHPERAGHVGHLALGLIEFDSAELAAALRGGGAGLLIVFLADWHGGG
jgi:hypothetical protein